MKAIWQPPAAVMLGTGLITHNSSTKNRYALYDRIDIKKHIGIMWYALLLGTLRMRQPDALVEFGSLLQGDDDPAAHRKYELVQNLITARIEDGTLPAGAALPSELQLARQLQLARSTIRQGMAALERDGLIRRIHGRGTYVHAEAPQRLQQTRSLFALLLPEPEAEVSPAFQKHFVAAASQYHHQVIVSSSATTADSFSVIVERLIQLNVSGVAFVPPANPVMLLPALLKLQERRIPVVSCCRVLAGLPSSSLPFPFEAIGRAAGELISRHGHQHVLFCAADQPDTEALVERGFRAGMGEQAQILTLRLHFSSLRAFHSEPTVSREVDRLFDRPNRPSAIFCAFDSLAELFYIILTKKGLRVPEDVSLVGFGGQERSSAFAQRLTSVVLDEKQFGARAVQMLRRICTPRSNDDPVADRQLSVDCFAGRTLRSWSDSERGTVQQEVADPLVNMNNK